MVLGLCLGQYLLPEAWEWREGRLFAYEVILQFVIKNHIIYTFGSLSTTPNQGMDLANSSLPLPNSSSDEVFYPRSMQLMMISRYGNALGITGPLWRESTSQH